MRSEFSRMQSVLDMDFSAGQVSAKYKHLLGATLYDFKVMAFSVYVLILLPK